MIRGDRVLITKDLVNLHSLDVVYQMEKYAGCEATITYITDIGFTLDIDDSEFYWNEKLLTLITIKEGAIQMNKVKEGYVLFDKDEDKYLDINQYQVNDFNEVEFYNTIEEAQDEFRHMDEPDNFTIRQIKVSVEIIKEFKRIVTFEQV